MQVELCGETQVRVTSGKTLATGEELTGWENTRNVAGLKKEDVVQVWGQSRWGGTQGIGLDALDRRKMGMEGKSGR